MSPNKHALPSFDINANIVHNPHVVILGAGASLAAFPAGDRFGKKLPLMNDIVKVIGLEKIVNKFTPLQNLQNFEELYSNLCSDDKNREIINKIEQKIYEYFQSLKIPLTLTLYDKLILSLRETDLIATFNWDPLLCLAYQRNRHLKTLPLLAFLHGNVFVGICREHKKMGFINCACSQCGRMFQNVDLLYPIKSKDYAKDYFIQGEWALLKEFLKNAVLITFFGYSAPKSDIEARNLMFDVWTENPFREFAQIEIIDILPKEELEDKWSEFFVRNHYFISKSFEESYLYHFPRRSGEAFVSAYLQNDPWGSLEHYNGHSLDEYQEWILRLKESEDSHNEDNTVPLSRW